MKLKEICDFLNSEVPLAFQERYDNSGLQVGFPDMEIKSALITLDVTENVIDEAVSENCNLIVSHHPVIFDGIKKITGSTLTERVLLSAISKNVAIYSAHTNLDSIMGGVSTEWLKSLVLGTPQFFLLLKAG